jgi:hypothetical protein
MNRIILGAVAVPLIGLGSIAGATTLVGSTTDPTGVNGLLVEGTTYDVTFSTSDYLMTFPSGPTFTTPTDASDAATALASFLQGAAVTGLGGDTCGLPSTDQPECQIYVPSGDAAGLVSGSQAHNQGAGWSEIGPEALAVDTDTLGLVGAGYDEWAVFAPTSPAVPEPATLSLLGLALAAVGLVSRRSRN